MKQQGFTLIELIVTIAIAAVLAMLAAPSFSEQLASAQVKSCAGLFYDELKEAQHTSSSSKVNTVILNKDKCNGVDLSGTPLEISFKERVPGSVTLSGFTPLTSDVIYDFSKSNTTKSKRIKVTSGKYAIVEVQ